MSELPNPGSPLASAMIDSKLAEYNWPSNPKNAARAGYEAARALLGQGERRLMGSSECPICGVDTPHRHTDADIVGWVKAQAQRFLHREVVVIEKADYEAPALISQGASDGLRGNYLVAVPQGMFVHPGDRLYLHPAAMAQGGKSNG